MDKEFLPLGSIVLLKNAIKNVAIIGYCVVEEGKDKIWDYMGCPYPFGVISSDSNLLFDINDIDKVVFKGYMDSEAEEFFVEMNKELKESKIDG